MAGEWQALSLRDAGVTLIDCDHRTPPAAERGYPYVAIPQMRGGHIDVSDARRITAADYGEWTRKAKAAANDVVLSRRCNPGETAFVPPGLDFALGQNLVLLRADGAKVYPPFLRWLVRGPEWWEQIGTFLNVGAVFDSLKCADVPKFTLQIPPLAEQRAIAHILGTLDDKIELNRRMSETLEAMARALFNLWLAEISPSVVKVADLIQEGVLEIGDGYRAKNSELGEPGLPFIRAGNLKGGIDTARADTLRHDAVGKAGAKVGKPGDVAFTSKGTIGRFARVTRFTRSFVYSPQVCYWRSLDHHRLQPSILYCWMQSDDLTSQIEAVAGQTDMAPYVSLRDQREMAIPIFPESQQDIAGHIECLLNRQAMCGHESTFLSELRDALLPKLISGQIRVKDAERFLEIFP